MSRALLAVSSDKTKAAPLSLRGQAAWELMPFTGTRRHQLASLAVPLVVPFILAGCMVGPNFEAPKTPDVAGYTPEKLADAEEQHFALGKDLSAEWWGAFH